MTAENHIVHRVLILARELIVKGWTTDVLARNQNGRDCDPEEDDACCWCAIGAICRAVASLTGSTSRLSRISGRYNSLKTEVNAHIRQFLPEHKGLDYVNDQLGKAAVLALFDQAISTPVT